MIVSNNQFISQEPIYSVEQQRIFRLKQVERSICKSNHSDRCYQNYLEKQLNIGFGQSKEIQYEKIEFVKPSLVILSPSLEINESEISKRTEKSVELLQSMNECRKRYGIVHVDKYSYIIGGYIFDPITQERRTAQSDYKYDPKTNLMINIDPLPGPTVSFGLAIGNDKKNVEVLLTFTVDLDGKYLVAVGGHSVMNKPLSKCYLMNIHEEREKWIPLPDLPFPTSGPGVGMFDGEIHVIGGFDILSSESLTHGDYFRFSLSVDEKWREETSIASVRARTLVLYLPNDNAKFGRNIYVAGGYDVSVKGSPAVVANVHQYNEQGKNWRFITEIPHLKLTHALSFYDDKLQVAESILKANDEYDSRILRSYDLKTNQWIEG